jgi:hypothetical protein
MSGLLDGPYAFSYPAQITIATELVAAERQVAGSGIGRHVLRTCRIEHFKQDKRSWIEHLGECG